MTPDQVRKLTDVTSTNLDRLRPLLRTFADLLENIQEEEQLQRALAIDLLRLLSEQIRRSAEQVDLDLHYGSRPASDDYGWPSTDEGRDYRFRPTPSDYGWDSEGGQI